MPKSLKPRSGARPKGTPSKQALLPRDIEDDVRRTARPTQQDDVLSRLARAIELLERDDARGAVTEAEKAKAMAPRSAAVREVLGMAYYGGGRWHDALTELKAARLDGSLVPGPASVSRYGCVGLALPVGRRAGP